MWSRRENRPATSASATVATEIVPDRKAERPDEPLFSSSDDDDDDDCAFVVQITKDQISLRGKDHKAKEIKRKVNNIALFVEFGKQLEQLLCAHTPGCSDSKTLKQFLKKIAFVL